MISDEQIHEAVRLAREASRQYQQQSWVQRVLSPAPQLRLNALGQLEVAEGARDTHDEWRRLNDET